MTASINIPPTAELYSQYYKNAFARVTKCAHCGTVGMREDAHPNYPSRFCGSEVKDAGAAKWKPPVYRRHWFKKTAVAAGQWLFKES